MTLRGQFRFGHTQASSVNAALSSAVGPGIPPVASIVLQNAPPSYKGLAASFVESATPYRVAQKLVDSAVCASKFVPVPPRVTRVALGVFAQRVTRAYPFALHVMS